MSNVPLTPSATHAGAGATKRFPKIGLHDSFGDLERGTEPTENKPVGDIPTIVISLRNRGQFPRARVVSRRVPGSNTRSRATKLVPMGRDARQETDGGPSTGPIPLLGMSAEIQRDHFFRKVLAELPAAIYTTDAHGHITYYNDAARELWGHAPPLGTSEWCGSWTLFWPDGTPLPHGDCPMAIAIKEKRSIRGMEAIAERPDGTRVPFIPYPTPLFDSSGMLIGAVNMLVDISDRIRAEDVRQQLAAIVESSDDAIISKNLSGIISSWNKAAERLFGYTAAEAIGQSILILIPDDRHDEEHEIIGKIKRGEKVEHYETLRRHKDGSLVPLSLTVSPVKDSGGRIIGASKIARDISERRRAEEQRDVLVGEMKHRSKNFAAIIDGIARQTSPKNNPDAAAILDGFVARLRAILLTGELVVDSLHRRAKLKPLFEIALQPFADPKRPASICGPACSWTKGRCCSLMSPRDGSGRIAR